MRSYLFTNTVKLPWNNPSTELMFKERSVTFDSFSDHGGDVGDDRYIVPSDHPQRNRIAIVSLCRSISARMIR